MDPCFMDRNWRGASLLIIWSIKRNTNSNCIDTTRELCSVPARYTQWYLVYHRMTGRSENPSPDDCDVVSCSVSCGGQIMPRLSLTGTLSRCSKLREHTRSLSSLGGVALDMMQTEGVTTNLAATNFNCATR
ncbi:hypothetical protein FOCG_04456 [Fusarium oxysporum f. sp. radicis-lycopersici 26381]|uniref:Uncharacterized protein n=1 Tax=Fusarium oxysporum Fo47 TaxID=660027 RepID=W9K6P2_FUSOX|nr:hypothetical protein FOZG_09595 [Fusarium oxysporum Fo47]EWZ89715.1 hypothetical protein FOWG_07633 [Fusarium oxysporum f. sp. lycopersici MN25]EXL57077.1 hypothetical protein FOCG_04456 [Fusarium oxysporum f. sp. radicis-lycopersici 26381]